MKNSINGFNSKLNKDKERINEQEDKNKCLGWSMRSKKNRVRDPENMMRRPNINLFEISKGKEIYNG